MPNGSDESIPDLRHLDAFLVIAEERHFGRAATRLHVAQPTLSQQLQRLEWRVGVKLVRRTSREVQLTAAGEAFRVEAELLVGQTRRAVRAARSAASSAVNGVRAGFNYVAGWQALMPALARSRREQPRLPVTLRAERTGPLVSAVLAGDLDLAVVYGQPADHRLESVPIADVPVVALLGSRHPWAERNEVTFRQVASQPCLLFSRTLSPALYDTVVAGAAQHGADMRLVYEIDDPMETCVELSNGGSVGFASETRARYERLNGLVGVPLSDPSPTVRLSAVWPARRCDPPVQLFIDILKTTLRHRDALRSARCQGRTDGSGAGIATAVNT